jgi:hypothetical protein
VLLWPCMPPTTAGHRREPLSFLVPV